MNWKFKKIFLAFAVAIFGIFVVGGGPFLTAFAKATNISAKTNLNFIAYTPDVPDPPTPPAPVPGGGSEAAQTGDFIIWIAILLAVIWAVAAFVYVWNKPKHSKNKAGNFIVMFAAPILISAGLFAASNIANAQNQDFVSEKIDVYVNTEGGPVHYGEDEYSNVQQIVNNNSKDVELSAISIEASTSNSDIGTWTATSASQEILFEGTIGSKTEFEPIVIKPGEAFEIEWNTNADSSDLLPVVGTTPAQIVYEINEVQEFTLSFNANGGEGIVPDAITAPAGTEVAIPGADDLSKVSYTFVCWNTNAEGSGTDYEENDTYIMQKTNDTLFAKWIVSEEYKNLAVMQVQEKAHKLISYLKKSLIEKTRAEQLIGVVSSKASDTEASIGNSSTVEEVDKYVDEFNAWFLKTSKGAFYENLLGKEALINSLISKREDLYEDEKTTFSKAIDDETKLREDSYKNVQHYEELVQIETDNFKALENIYNSITVITLSEFDGGHYENAQKANIEHTAGFYDERKQGPTAVVKVVLGNVNKSALKPIVNDNYGNTYSLDENGYIKELYFFDKNITISVELKECTAYAGIKTVTSRNDTLDFRYDEHFNDDDEYEQKWQCENTDFTRQDYWALYTGGEGKQSTVTTVNFYENFKDARPKNCAYWFYNSMHAPQDTGTITKINGLNYLNTEECTTMLSMFRGCTKLEELDISNFNTSKVTNMNNMFMFMYRLKELKFPKTFDTSNVTTMYQFCDYCYDLTTLDLSGFKTDNLKSVNNAFSECNNLVSIDVSNFNVKSITDFGAMFEGDKASNPMKLKYIYCNDDWSIDASSKAISSSMFEYCVELPNYKDQSWNIKNAFPDNGTSGYFTKTSDMPKMTLNAFEGGHFENEEGETISDISGMVAASKKVKVVLTDSSKTIASITDDEGNTYKQDEDGFITINFSEDMGSSLTVTLKDDPVMDESGSSSQNSEILEIDAKEAENLEYEEPFQEEHNSELYFS